MSVIAFIPVRGGSKSIPKKNIKSFCGRPLVYWATQAASGAVAIDKVVVATDDDEIKRVVLHQGLSNIEVYDRNSKNATDHSSTEDVMLEYIEQANLSDDDTFVLIQATSPFLMADELMSAIQQLKEEKADSLLSCVRVKRFFWEKSGSPVNYNPQDRPRRQDFDGALMENGAVYMSSVGLIKSSKNRISGKISVYEMPEYSAIELDEEDDWVLAEHFMRKYVLLKRKLIQPIKLVLSDIDGVLTDAGMYYTESGDEIKKFSTYDGMAFKLLQKRGVKTGFVTSEDRKLNRRRAEKLGIDVVYHGAIDKLSIVQALCVELEIDIDQVAFIGDDINDFKVLQNVGLSACPANAQQKIKNIPGIIHLSTKGGDGAFREFAEIIMANYLEE